MARLPRLCPKGIPCHIIQRGNNRSICFVCDEDYRRYLALLLEGAVSYRVDVHAWVLMTNHVHLLATSNIEGGISKMIQHVGASYVRYFNKRYQRSGTLWEGRFKSCLIDAEDYFLVCQRYIELNPVRAEMVIDPGHYSWSSYRANALGERCDITSPHDIYNWLGASPEARVTIYRSLFSEALDCEVIDDLSKSTNSCMAFGGEYFKQQIELSYARRVKPGVSGPKAEH